MIQRSTSHGRVKASGANASVCAAKTALLFLALTSIVVATVNTTSGSEIIARPRNLSFEDRVRAQEAIERVYYSHAIGATRPFEEAVPRALVESRVRTYLGQSDALARYWNAIVTMQALERELERIASATRFPERLQEIYASLNHDPMLILECFVRPVLVDRLARAFFAFDERIHGDARLEIERIHSDLAEGRLNPSRPHQLRREVVPSLEEREESYNEDFVFRLGLGSRGFVERQETARLAPGRPGPIEENRETFRFTIPLDDSPSGGRLAVYEIPKTYWDDWWREATMIFDSIDIEPSLDGVWRSLPSLTTANCSSDDTWDNASLNVQPEGRRLHAAVWTGSVMLLWGGTDNGTQMPGHGWRYDPLIDTWSMMSSINAPQGRRRPTAVWTGTRMIVWGGEAGSTRFQTGGRYDPLSDTWLPTTVADAPAGRSQHSAVWTGSRMIVWGGSSGSSYLDSGGSYDPVTDSWYPTSVTGAPAARARHTAVWDGNDVIVWGGQSSAGATHATGARYDPASDTWTATKTTGAPMARYDHAAVWTGQEMVIWGGSEGVNTGGRYHPGTDSWLPVTATGAPEGRWKPTAIWTGTRMIVWGGLVANGTGELDSGGLYDPATDTWEPTTPVNAPLRRVDHTSVWTGNQMVVWGGTNWDNQHQYPTGGRYDPVANAWTPTSATSNGPTPRSGHSAVWTGTMMIVWGGGDAAGGRYDPVTDSWIATTLTGAPMARGRHTAVWTGDRMIVWGGVGLVESNGQLQQTGLADGRSYDPIADSWELISETDAPSGRSEHKAVWTGHHMIVWGGYDWQMNAPLGTGGKYNPVSDQWELVSALNAPSPRYAHTAVWTGSRMVVWGGRDLSTSMSTGGSYDPNLDGWQPTSLFGAPTARRFHSAVWTGNRMIVWGGRSTASSSSSLATGGLYDPGADRWQFTATTGAPLARSSHTAVWTGDVMAVWGGQRPDGFYLDTGGRYDPAVDSWTTVSTAGAPSPRHDQTAVWNGDFMLVWGGAGLEGGRGNGGRYIVAYSPDADFDGQRICDGDCDDSDPMTHAGAPQTCDAVNNDCQHPAWPSLAGTNEADDDGDSLSECQGDCDDANDGAWGPPDEARNAAFLSDAATLTWSPPLTPGAVSLVYDTLRSVAPSNFSSAAVCTETNGADTISVDYTTPAIGQILYYLVRAENSCPGGLGAGPAGTDSDGVPRDARACP